jgi:glycosyltransferase involved in cell wall biosynthesis
MTSAHPRYDTRIFVKECRTLVEAGYEVFLVVADGRGDETKEQVRIVDAGRPSGRLARMLSTSRKVYRAARALDADVYHFHDPELIPYGRKLQGAGKKVVYDVHEDLPRQILAKHYLPARARPLVSRAVEIYENRSVRKFDSIVAAYPYLRDRLLRLNPETCDVTNYPVPKEFEGIPFDGAKENAVCYIGSITRNRGICELLDALEQVDVTLHLGGDFSPPELLEEVKRKPGWRRVVYHGFASREMALKIYARSRAGIATLHPVGHYPNALAVKMFEYMLAGIPVVCSNFPLWKKILDESDCGLAVDPSRPDEIAQAIRFLLDHPEKAKELGQNGRRSILNRYNWERERAKLIAAYRRLAPAPGASRTAASEAGA